MLDRSKDATAWILRKLLWIAGWLIRGPSAGLTIVTSVICALFLFEPMSVTAEVVDVRTQVMIVTGAIFIGSLYAFYRISRQQDYSWYDTVVWLGIASFAVFMATFNDSLLGFLKRIPDLKMGPQRLVSLQVMDCTAGSSNAACYINGLYKIIIWGLAFLGRIAADRVRPAGDRLYPRAYYARPFAARDAIDEHRHPDHAVHAVDDGGRQRDLSDAQPGGDDLDTEGKRSRSSSARSPRASSHRTARSRSSSRFRISSSIGSDASSSFMRRRRSPC